MTLSRHAVAAGAVGLGLALVLAAFGALAPALAAGPLDVSLVNTSFQPADLTVHTGDTVTWTVTAAIAQPHSVTSGSPGDPEAGKLFDSTITLRNDGDTFQFKFANPGTYAYFCQVHPTTMRGTITVVGPGGSGAPAPASLPPASGNPSGTPGPGAGGGPGATAGPVGSAGPTSSGEPAVPPGSEKPPVAASDKAIAAGILVLALLILAGAAWLYRRMNRA